MPAVIVAADQKSLDAQFAAFMEQEYTEDKIGELEEEEV